MKLEVFCNFPKFYFLKKASFNFTSWDALYAFPLKNNSSYFSIFFIFPNNLQINVVRLAYFVCSVNMHFSDKINEDKPLLTWEKKSFISYASEKIAYFKQKPVLNIYHKSWLYKTENHSNLSQPLYELISYLHDT